MLPPHLAARLDAKGWTVPPVLKWLKKAGGVSEREFARTWNTGIGMVIVVKDLNVPAAIETLTKAGERPLRIGKLVKNTGEGVVMRAMEHWD